MSQMQILVSNKIIVNEPTHDLLCWCKNNLILDNPDFHKKEKMGLSTLGTPRNIFLYEKIGNSLHLPFGCLAMLWKVYGQKCEWMRLIAPFKPFYYKSSINLYPYQENAVKKAFMQKNGILLAPCGSGKTQMGLELVARLKGRTLWLTHTQDLLHQSMERAKSVFDCDLKSFGTITGGKVNIGEGLTFATVQTMAKLDLTEYKDYFDCVIVDEVQHCAGSPTKVSQFYKVVSALSCRYKYGLTATLHRADGLEESIKALIGDVVAEVSKEEVKHTTSPVYVKQIDTGYMPDMNCVLAGDGTVEYSSLVKDLTHNEKRFKIVSDTINELKSVIVLANRVEYLQELQKAYPYKSICLSKLGNSKSAKQLRKNSISDLNCGKLDCIFATYQLAKEGLDAPSLRYVVFATPEKDETTVIQSAGRVGRKADGKEYGTVIDFCDDFGLLKGWRKKRERFYKRLDFNIL